MSGDDLTAGLSPEEKQKWLDQFGPLPTYSSDTAVKDPQVPDGASLSPQEKQSWLDQFGPTPSYSNDTAATSSAGDVTVSPMPVEQAGQQIQDANANRSYAQGIPVRPPPPGYENSGGSWEVDDDGQERFYAPAAASDIAGGDIQRSDPYQSLPRSTNIDDLRDYIKRLDSVRATEKEEHKPTASTDRIIRKAEDARLELAAGSPEGKRDAGEGLFGGGSAQNAAEGAAYTRQREQNARYRENARRIQAGLPTLEEEAKRKARAPMPVPGGGRVIFSAAVPVQDDGYDENGVGKISVSHPQTQQPVGPGEGAGSNAVAPDKAQGSGWPSITDFVTAGPNAAIGLGQSLRQELLGPVADNPADHAPGIGGSTQTLNEFTPGEPSANNGEPFPVNYPPAQYIPGKRTPAAWSVTEGQQVPVEDQEALAQARVSKRAAVEAGRQAGVDQYTNQASLIAAQQKAVADIDTLNRKRQLDNQAALRAQTDKLAKMTQSIRDKSLDDEQMFALPGAAGQFFAAIGQAIGAGAAARTGGVNHAAEYVKGRINEIVQKQKMQADKDKNSLGNQENLVAQMRKLFGDEELGDQAAKLAYLERAKLQAQEQAATSKAAGVNANALDLLADLDKDGAKEKTAFDLMALDKVQRRDVMTKPQVIGGPPTGGNAEGAANPALSFQMPIAFGPYARGERYVANSEGDAKELKLAINGYAILKDGREQAEAIAKANPTTVNIPGTKAYNDYMAIVTNAIGNVGHINAVAKQPVIDSQLLEKILTPSASNSLPLVHPGSSVTERFDAALRAYEPSVTMRMRTASPEAAHRYVNVTPSGKVLPQHEYTGKTVVPQNAPRGFTPVDNTGSERRDERTVDQPPDIRHVTEPTKTGKKKRKGGDSESHEIYREDPWAEDDDG